MGIVVVISVDNVARSLALLLPLFVDVVFTTVADHGVGATSSIIGAGAHGTGGVACWIGDGRRCFGAVKTWRKMGAAGWDGTSICDLSLPEPLAKEAPPRGGNCRGCEVSMGDNVGGAASPTARAGCDGTSILGPSLPETLSLLGVRLLAIGLLGSAQFLACIALLLAWLLAGLSQLGLTCG